nr:MAG TPA: hypothetical protein [Caudoviricetes sp.]
MKNKEQFDREITSFKETLRELKQRYDVKKTVAKNRIDVILWNLEELEKELKKDVFILFVEQKLNINLTLLEKFFIAYGDRYKEALYDVPAKKSILLECIRMAYKGKDISNGSNIKERLIEIPIKFSFEYRGVLVPCGMLSETMDKLYGKNWRYCII